MVCEMFGITRQAYYQKRWREEAKAKEQVIIVELVSQIRRKHPYMGTRKMIFKIQPMLAAEWTMPIFSWKKILNQLKIYFDRDI